MCHCACNGMYVRLLQPPRVRADSRICEIPLITVRSLAHPPPRSARAMIALRLAWRMRSKPFGVNRIAWRGFAAVAADIDSEKLQDCYFCELAFATRIRDCHADASAVRRAEIELEDFMLRRTVQLLCFACFIAATSRAADEPLVGKWKLNLSKSKLADQMTIAPAGDNKYTLIFAGVGDTETLVADGTDQPGVSGSTISVTIEAPDRWKIVRKLGGRTVLTAIWKLSDDGKALTDTFISNQPDGSTSHIDLVYKRAEATAGGSGIPGTWETTEEKADPFEIEIRPYESDGLSFLSPGGGPTTNVKFDGKDYPPSPAAGSTTSGRRVGDSSIELTKKLKGKIIETREITVSPDLNTLTMTRHLVDQRLPNVLIFDRT